MPADSPTPSHRTQEADDTLSPQEIKKIKACLGRSPNSTERALFSVMWSEHCAYVSTRKHLALLPKEGPHVLCGPGENAGIIDLGNDLACVFKIESHNHPSFIEPYRHRNPNHRRRMCLRCRI